MKELKDLRCPNCQGKDIEEVKTWELRAPDRKTKSGRSYKITQFRVHLYECGFCTRRFRQLERI